MQIRYEKTLVGTSPRVSVVAPFAAKESIKRGLGRWEKQRKMWTVPFTPLALWRVRSSIEKEFPDAEHVVHDDVAEINGRVLRADRVALRDFPRSKMKPWAHQQQGSSMIGEMAGVMLNWDMGSGKTFAVLNAIVEYGFQSTLVACPSTVVSVWVKECRKHLPEDFECRVLDLRDGGVADRGKKIKRAYEDCMAMRVPLIAAINYEAIWRAGFGNVVEKLDWDLVVADESQRIGNAFSKVGRYMGGKIGPRGKHRVCLSGTPMGNGAQDLFGQLLFCEPGLFGESFTRFRSRYCVMGGFEGKQVVDQQNVEELSQKLSIISTRVMLSDVVDLPLYTETEIPVTLGKYGRKVYEDLKENLIAECREGVVTAANAITKLLRLQQVTSGYTMVEDEDGRYGNETHAVITGTEKYDALVELLNSADKHEPFVVFCRFTHDIQSVRAAAVVSGRACWEISGASKDQDAWEEDCGRGEGSVIAVQIQAGGVGIDLTAARYCVYYSLGFSLNDYLQSRARCYRPGQKKTVFYYHLIAEETVDQIVYKALKNKKKVVDAVLEGVMPAKKEL